MKVRAWDEDNKKMIYSDEMQGYRIDIDKNSELIMYREETNYDFSQLKFNFISLPMMVSTGLKDKNGTEIYEGDILKTQTRGLVAVRIERGNAMVTYQSGVNTRTSLTLSSFLDKYKVKVIGNIYENIELLEV